MKADTKELPENENKGVDQPTQDQVAISTLERYTGSSADEFQLGALMLIYTLMKTIEAQEGVLLKYDRAVDYDAQSAVTFASMAFY